MFNWLADYLSYNWWIKLPFVISAMVIFFICVHTIIVNTLDWLVSIYLYYKTGWFQLSYPNFKDKVVRVKYTHFIVNNKTGEIFYMDHKNLKRLKKKKLIIWDGSISNYFFQNENLTKIKDLIRPHIIIWDKTLSEDEA